jgi:uncharacterized protein YfaS (alpha-2-macroglobulin family)
MTKKRLFFLIGLALLAAVVLASCRKQEELDLTSDAQIARPTASAEAQPSPTIASEPATTPTATPQIVYDWPPQLVYSSLAPGKEVKLDDAITVRFDQPMDQDSVEDAFSITRADGESPLDGLYEWPRPDTLIFTPEDTLERHQRYNVQIDETAEAESGRPVQESYSLQVETVGFLEVSQTIPEDGADDVQTDAVITVMFNRPVVPLVGSGQQADLPQPLTFQPAVEGTGEWTSTSIYRFTPAEPLAGATQYQVTVEAGLEDTTGGLLAEAFNWRFTTLRPDVVETSPDAGAVDVNPTQPISVTFNMPMDPASTEAAISLDPAISAAFAWTADGRQVGVIPETRLQLGTEYRLTIADSARSANGQASMSDPAVIDFTTVPFPGVIRTEPGSGETAHIYQRGVNVQFASPMDFATLEDKVRIEPAPDEVSYFLEGEGTFLFVDFDLLRNTAYTVSIPGSAADPYGNTLGEDYVWRFETPGFAPLVSLNLPSQISQLSTSHPTDVDVIHRNVSSFDAQLYDAALPIQPLLQPFMEFEPAGEPLRSWSIPLESAQDVAGVQTLSLANGDVLPAGVYFLELDAPEIDQDQRFWQNLSNLIVVADTNLVVKEMFGAVHVWATDLATGQPAAGRNLTLYDNFGAFVGTATTDENGLATIDYTSPTDQLQGVLVVSNEPGQPGFGVASTNWEQGISPWEFGLEAAFSDEPPRFAYLYTDRPIYRPGDTVHFKGILRDTDYGRYPLPTESVVTAGLDFISAFEELNWELELTADANGEFSGEYEIPEDAGLGNYRLYLKDVDVWNDRTFTVAEYRRPEFQVTATADQDEALRGETVDVAVEASYFFGGPASDLDIHWTIYEDSYVPPWEGPYYSFGDSGRFFDSDGLPPPGFGGAFGNFVTSGEGVTDAEGRLVVTLPADLLDEVEAGSRIVSLEASVFDISNFPISARAEVVFHAAETYVGVVMGDRVATAGTGTNVDVITVDWDGQPVADSKVEVVFYRREWEPFRDDTFGQYVTRWEPVDTEIERATVTTDDLGQGSVEFVPPEGGVYLAVATVSDDAGRSQTSTTTMWVADSNFVGWRTDDREKRMELVADKSEYRPGDVARVLVQSPFAGPVNAWLTIERGGLIEQRIITLQSSSDVLEIPITSHFAPNVHVSVAAVKGVDETNPYADMRLGITELVVSPEQLALNLSLTPQSDRFEPGDTAAYEMVVTDYQGRPVQANFSLALVDLAVLTLKPDNAPHILEAFYDRQPIRSRTGSGLIISGEGLEVEIPLEQLGLGGGGGGGELEAEASFALQDEEDEGVRRDFPDTAYWEAQVSTDADGRATFEIPLPDTVTTWRLSSKAVSDHAATNETLVGQSEADIVSTLPLLIRPVTPRFFTVGDELQIGAAVHNNTEESLDVTVSLETSGLTLGSPAEQEVSIEAGGSELVRWEATVDDVPFADLTFRAEGGDYRDATKPTFGIAPDQLVPVVRFTGEDVVGTSGVLDEAGRRVEAVLLPPEVDERQGQVAMQLNPSLAAALTEALDYLNELEQRPACAHAVTDQLLANVATALAVQKLELDDSALATQLDKAITQGIDQLESLQKRTGGWGWCYSERTDPFLSAYAQFALAKARQAGYEVDNQVFIGAIRYLNGQIEEIDSLTERYEVNRQAWFLYVLAESEQGNFEAMDELFLERRALLDPYARALLAVAYESVGGSDNQIALLADLNDSAIISASGAHWEDAEPDWDNLSSDIRGTAMIIEALARLDPDNLLAPNAVRWLMVARTAGHWPTGQENAWSILALTEWMAASGELEADYDYRVDVNGAELSSGHFDRNNITESEELSVPTGELLLEETNFLDFQRGEGDGRLYYTTHVDSFISAENLEPVNRGVIVQRAYFDADCDPEESECQPISEIGAGQQVRVELTIIVPNDLVYAVVEDHFPAGAEAIDPGLETSVSGAGGEVQRVNEDYIWGYWGWWFFNRIEYRDDRVVFLSDFLPAGTYQYSYTLQTAIPGEYQVNPATAREEFFPEVFGRSEGFLFTIAE